MVVPAGHFEIRAETEPGRCQQGCDMSYSSQSFPLAGRRTKAHAISCGTIWTKMPGMKAGKLIVAFGCAFATARWVRKQKMQGLRVHPSEHDVPWLDHENGGHVG